MTLHQFEIKVAGHCYQGEYLSAAMAIILAQCLYGVHNASARRVS